MAQDGGCCHGSQVTGGHVGHVDVVRHLVARHDGHMLRQHGQVEQRLHITLCQKPGQKAPLAPEKGTWEGGRGGAGGGMYVPSQGIGHQLGSF